MKASQIFYRWALLSLILLVTGCTFQESTPVVDQAKPLVTLSNPKPGDRLEVGREVKVQSTSVDPEGISRVELVINGEPIWADANAQPQPNTPFIVAQPWKPGAAGRYIIQVRAYNMANIAGESAPLTVEVETEIAGAIPPTPTATPTATLTALPPSPSPTSLSETTPSPTTTPAPATPTSAPPVTPSATPRPQSFDPTGLEPEGRFADIWFELGEGDSRLGYPTGPEIVDRNFAQQYFEKGLMFWWDSPDNPDLIWVIDAPAADWQSGASSNRYPDTWQSTDPEIACEQAQETGPVRGFGKLWCERPELQTRLGFPREPERGSGGAPPYARAQFFQGGVMLYNPANSEVFVLFDQGDWRWFEY